MDRQLTQGYPAEQSAEQDSPNNEPLLLVPLGPAASKPGTERRALSPVVGMEGQEEQPTPELSVARGLKTQARAESCLVGS